MIHASNETLAFGASDAALGTRTESLVPSKLTAVLVSPVSNPSEPSVGPFTYAPRLRPTASLAVWPEASPSLQ